MSHIDTFDPKRGKTQGPGKAIKTKADFQVTEYLPKTAKIADKICLIRSMTAKIGVHGPAQYFMRTAFAQRNTVKHPNLGAWSQHYLGSSHDTLPSFRLYQYFTQTREWILSDRLQSRFRFSIPDTGLRNIATRGGSEALGKKLKLSEKLSSFFSARYQDDNVRSYREFYDNTLRLLKSKDLDAFDISKENRCYSRKIRFK
jgi:hypothetical protein